MRIRVLCFWLAIHILRFSMAGESRVPKWDARGIGPLPWQGVSCLSVSPDGQQVVVGTIAPPGDPNVIVLDAIGKPTHHDAVGQRWIQNVVAPTDNRTCFALCTMPEGRAQDAPAAYQYGGRFIRVGPVLGEDEYSWTMFHYGDHSNHLGTMLGAWSGGAVGVWHDRVQWFAQEPAEMTLSTQIRLPRNSVTVCLAVAPNGDVVVGTASPSSAASEPQTNLWCWSRGDAQPKWTRIAKNRNAETMPPRRGIYGQTTRSDGTRQEIAQSDVELRAPLSISIQADRTGAVQFVATADHVGWQRWLDSPAADGRPDLAVVGYTQTGVGAGGPLAAFVWLQPDRKQ
jgi:hypothetical protein